MKQNETENKNNSPDAIQSHAKEGLFTCNHSPTNGHHGVN